MISELVNIPINITDFVKEFRVIKKKKIAKLNGNDDNMISKLV